MSEARRARVVRGADAAFGKEHIGKVGTVTPWPAEEDDYVWDFREDGETDEDFEAWGGLALYADEVELIEEEAK